MALSVLGTAELQQRVLIFLGPHAALAARGANDLLSTSWTPKAIAELARTGAWQQSLRLAAFAAERPASLHALLEPFSRRTAGSPGHTCSSPSAAAAATSPMPSGTLLFDTVFVLLALAPHAAEEPQVQPRPDEECSSVENMQRSPLIVAARCGLVGVAWLIAQHCTVDGGGLNRQDAMGCSALRYAIVNKDERLCACLLSFPALNLEVTDSRGDTPLLQAVASNAPVACRMLLRRGANSAFANRGQTALDLAESLGYNECAAVLGELGAPHGSGLAVGRSESEDDDDLDCSGSDPDPELHEALRESRRLAASRIALQCCGEAPESPGDGESSEEDGQRRADIGQRRKKRRWDSGGLFIKTRGGPPRMWQG